MTFIIGSRARSTWPYSRTKSRSLPHSSSQYPAICYLSEKIKNGLFTSALAKFNTYFWIGLTNLKPINRMFPTPLHTSRNSCSLTARHMFEITHRVYIFSLILSPNSSSVIFSKKKSSYTLLFLGLNKVQCCKRY